MERAPQADDDSRSTDLELDRWLRQISLQESSRFPGIFTTPAWGSLWQLATEYAWLRLYQCLPLVQPEFTEAQRSFLEQHLQPFFLMYVSDNPAAHTAAAQRFFLSGMEQDTAVRASTRANASIEPSRRLRVGFFLSDFYDGNTIAELATPLFEHLDQSVSETFGYCSNLLVNRPITTETQRGLLRARARLALSQWREIPSTTSDIRLSAMIEADQIDVLVDVNGLTGPVRAAVLSRQLAPILVNWLGQPGSIGSGFHHYMIADDFIVPAAEEANYSERVIRLPCYHPNDRSRQPAAGFVGRQQYGLPGDAFVFANFGLNLKITSDGFSRWMQILRETPRGVLWLIGSDPQIEGRLRSRAAAQGVAPARLVFSRKTDKANYLARFHLVDLYLDTSPFSCPTTGADALWMGVPVLTCPARSYIARACGSVVRAAGVPELICRSQEEYARRAIDLATTHRDELAGFRARLLASRETSVLFDIEGYARTFEAALFQMRDEYLAGRRPVPDLSKISLGAAA